MNPTLRIYYQSALDLKLPVRYFTASECLEISLGGDCYFFVDNCVPLNYSSSDLFAQYRGAVRLILARANIPKAEAFYVEKKELNHRENLRNYRVLVLNKRIIGVVEASCVQKKIFFEALGQAMNPKNATILSTIAEALTLDWLQFDISCTDLNSRFNDNEWFITEINLTPDIMPYEQPNKGKKINVSRKLLKHLIHRHRFAYLYNRLVTLFSIKNTGSNSCTN